MPWRPAGTTGCDFALGFAQMRAQLGTATVGPCLGDESFDPSSGGAVQLTARGLLAWRRADGATAFSDGHRTWVAGPSGLQRRLNDERFCWEADADTRRCLEAAPGPDSAGVVPFEWQVAALATALVETLALRAELEWNGWSERGVLWLARAISV